MKKMKKLLCLVLVVCFALSMVMVSNAAVPTTDHSKAYALKMYMIGGTDPNDAGLIQDAANKYLKDKINATLKFTVFNYGDYGQKMTLKEASNEKFDIMFTANWENSYADCATKGYLVDLTDLLDRYAPKTKALLGPKIIKGCSIGGRLYAIPANKEMAHDWQLLYRKDIAKELNLDMSKIKTLADAEPIFTSVHKAKPAMYTYETVAGESAYRVLDFEKMNGDNYPGAIYSPVYNKKGAAATKVVNDFATPEAIGLYKLMHKWYGLGFIRKDSDTVTDFQGDLKAGKVFSVVQSGKPGKDAEMSAATGQDFGSVEITTPVATSRDSGTGSMNGISKTSADPIRSLEFLELVNTDTYLSNLLVYGIEGKHYEFADKAKGIVKILPAGSSNYNRAGNGWSTGNQFINYLTTLDDPNKWTNYKKFNEAATLSPLPLFTYNPKAVKTQLAALTAAKQQYMPLLETGKGDPNKYLPMFTAKLKASGLEKVLADMQKQVNAVLK